MNIKTKIVIFIAASLLSFAGFNLIASLGAVEMVKAGNEAGYELIVNVKAKSAFSATSSFIKG